MIYSTITSIFSHSALIYSWVFTGISTLLESGNHYSKMFELTDSIGNRLFETISITLVCGTWSLYTVYYTDY